MEVIKQSGITVAIYSIIITLLILLLFPKPILWGGGDKDVLYAS